MRGGWQVVACALALSAGSVFAQAPPLEEKPAKESPKSFDWKTPDIGRGRFSDALGMLDREREEYAKNLAAEAAAKAMDGKGSKASLTEVRKLLALSLQLAPRNRAALVLGFQLSRGLLPEQKPDGYSREVFARLLITRADALRKQGGDENLLLARAFTEVAADLDPKNEDAVYASEVQRLDHQSVDWSVLTEPVK